MDFSDAVSDCDVVLDTIGAEVHEKSYTVLKKGGRLVYVVARPFKDISGNFDVETRRVIVSTEAESLHEVMDLASKGVLRPRVSKSLPLAEFRDAFHLVESGRAGGKVVLELLRNKSR